MVKAVIDIGSNTINLLIAKWANGKYELLEDRKIHARLARGGINAGFIAPEAFERGINALAEHKFICDNYNLQPDDIVTYATASVRAASNGGEFSAQAYERFGFKVQTIDGETEALLIHAGIKNGFPLDRQKVVIMDIGGGSVEFIITDKTEIYWKKSFYLGVSKLLDRFSPSDPPLASELADIKCFVKQELNDLFNALQQYKPVSLIGSSGSFDTIRTMLESAHNKEDISEETWYPIAMSDLRKMAKELSLMTTEERKQVEGMDAMRAEYFPMAFVLIEMLLECLPKIQIYQCSYALKEGAFFYHFSS